MSARIYGMVFERYPGGGGELLLALALGDHAHDDGTHIFPSVAGLSAKTRQSERTVQYQLRNMEAAGWLQKVRDEQRGRPGMSDARRRGREYRINPDWIAGKPLQPANPPPDGAQEKGAKIAPFSGDDQVEKGAIAIAPIPDEKGCNPEQKRVQSDAEKGATAIAPEPSVNHQYSNHQEESAGVRPPGPPGPDPASSPPTGLTHGSQDPDVSARFPADWQPCDLTRSLLQVRKLPMPAEFVISAFVAHWAGRWVTPRRIPNEFVKWVCREAVMHGGRVPTASDSGVTKAEAEAAWQEVRTANQRDRLPEGGWSKALTAQALAAIGGMAVLRDMRTDQVQDRQREFVRAYLAAGNPIQSPSDQPRRVA